MATVKCVWGAPCSGKSTFISENMRDGELVFDYDAVRQALTGKDGHAESSDGQKSMLNRLRYTYAASAKDTDVDVAWFVCLRPNEQIKAALGEDTEYIKMEATKEECLERLDKDDTRPDKEAMAAIIEDWFAEEEKHEQPEEKKAMNNNREYRNMDLRILPMENEEKSYMVEGYASTYEPYKLLTIDGVDMFERIEPTAFDDADLSDVVFRVDHEGRVYARSSAGTVNVWHDEHGLGQRTDLSRTQAARELFADIEAGNYPKMSFAFTVAEDHFDKATHTRVIDRIAKVFDVSPVSFPANPTTELSVSTRDYFNGVIEAEKAERLEREKRERQKQLIKLLLEG